MDLHVSRGACPVGFALSRNSRMSAGFCAFLQPHSTARDAFSGPIHESPPRLLRQKLRIQFGCDNQTDKKLLTWKSRFVLLVSSVYNCWNC